MRVPMTGTGSGDDPHRPDLPDGYVGGYRLTPDGDYLLTDWDDRDARIAALEAEVAQLRARTETVERDVTAVRSLER